LILEPTAAMERALLSKMVVCFTVSFTIILEAAWLAFKAAKVATL